MAFKGENVVVLFYLLALIIVVIDQVTKAIIVRSMSLSETIPLIEGVFHITSHRNRGAAFGILQDARLFFIVVTVIVVAAIIWYMPRLQQHKLSLTALSLILGGAVGNFIDRLLQGEVVDFLDFRLINFPIFNVADSAIVIGVVLLLLDSLRDSKRTPSQGDFKLDGEGGG